MKTKEFYASFPSASGFSLGHDKEREQWFVIIFQGVNGVPMRDTWSESPEAALSKAIEIGTSGKYLAPAAVPFSK